MEILIFGAITGFLYAFGKQLLNFIPVVTNFFFGYRFFCITQQDKVIIISRKLREYTSDIRDNEDAMGFFCGWGYFGWVIVNDKWLGGLERRVIIFTNKKRYDEFLEDPNPPPASVVNDNITMYENTSIYNLSDYKPRTVTLTKNARPIQRECIDRIISMYRNEGAGRNITVFLHGGVGTGKSMTAMMLANRLQATICKDLRPSNPGSSLRAVYTAANPSPTKPFICVFEEADILLKRIHNVELPPHKLLRMAIVDKTSWNNMFDDIDNGLYPFMITILTSNCPPEKINEMDPAYIRPGRVHFCYEMKEPREEQHNLLDIIIDH